MTESSSQPEKSINGPRYRFGLAEIGLMFCIALVVRMVHILSLKASPIFAYKIGDAARYDNWARTIAEGNWFGDGVFYQAPLYPYFLGSIYSLLGDDILTVRRVQAVLGAIACCFILKTAGNLFGRRSGWIAGLFLAFYAPSIFLESLIQKSILDLFFISMLLWLLSETLYSAKPFRYWIGIGLATGALCLTRENALVLLPVLGLWVLLIRNPVPKPIRYRQRFYWGAAFSIGLVLTLGPVVARNYAIGGQLHLTTSQLGPNFYIGNHAKANGTYQPLIPGRGDAKFEQADAVRLAEAETGRELSPKEVSQFWLSKSLQYISQQPVQWAKLLLWKFSLTINATEIIDTEDQYTVARWSPILQATGILFQFGILVPLGMTGIYLSCHRWREFWGFYLILAAFAATVILFFVFGRYRFPIAPILIPFAAFTIDSLFRSATFSVRKNIRYVPVVIAFSLLIICNLSLINREVPKGVTLSNYGVQAMIRSDYPLAEKFLQESLNCQQDNPLVHNNLGVLYRELGQTDKALKHFKTAVRLEPDDPLAQSNLQKLLASLADKTPS